MTILRTHIEFCSDAFPQTQNEIDQWEGQIWAESLAKYLVEQFNQQGIASDYCLEDWGCFIELDNEQYPHIGIGCNRYEDEYKNSFLIFLHPATPTIRKWLFKKIDISNQLNCMADTIEKILAQHSEIYNIRWWDEQDK